MLNKIIFLRMGLRKWTFILSFVILGTSLFSVRAMDDFRMMIQFNPSELNQTQDRSQCCEANSVALSSLNKLSLETGVDLVLIKPMAFNAYVISVKPSSLLQFKLNSEKERSNFLSTLISQLRKSPLVKTLSQDIVLVPLDTPTRANQWDMLDSQLYSVKADTPLFQITKGEGINVGVIDTGSCPNNTSIHFLGGYDFVTKSRDPQDLKPGTIWHGCHVSGTIAAHLSIQGDLEGVAPEANIVALNIFGNTGNAYTSDFVDAIEWGLGKMVVGIPDNYDPVKVFNISLGTSSPYICPSLVQDALNDAYNAGVPVVVSAGNSDADASKYVFSDCVHVISVGATQIEGVKSSYSNYGSSVSIAAPGTDIWSTIGVSPFYGELSGTSMATPHVVGVIALILKLNPNLKTVDAITSELTKTASPFGTPQTNFPIGVGIVNALNAVQNVISFDLAIPSLSQLHLTSVLSPLEYCDPIENQIPSVLAIDFTNTAFSGTWRSQGGLNCLSPFAYNNPILSESGSILRVKYYDSTNGLSNEYEFTGYTHWKCSPNVIDFICRYVV